MPNYGRADVKKKQELIRALLLALVKDDGDFPKEYRGVKTSFAKFRRWTAGEGMKMRFVNSQLVELIKNLHLDSKKFKRSRRYYALGGSGDFFIDVANKRIILDSGVASPQESVEAFLRGAMLFLKTTDPAIQNTREQLFRLNQEIDDFESSVFEEDPTKMDEILELRQQAFSSAAAHKDDLLKVLEEDAIGQ